MPNPKRRHSKSRRGKRRAHDALRIPQTVVCPNCQEPRMSHRVCPKCGFYKGREVIHIVSCLIKLFSRLEAALVRRLAEESCL